MASYGRTKSFLPYYVLLLVFITFFNHSSAFFKELMLIISY